MISPTVEVQMGVIYILYIISVCHIVPYKGIAKNT
jgi:hypothetical protein